MSKQIYNLLKQSNISIGALAKDLKMHRQTLSFVLNKKKSGSKSFLEALAGQLELYRDCLDIAIFEITTKARQEDDKEDK